MEQEPSYTFDGFRLEPPPGGLWRGDALRLGISQPRVGQLLTH